MIDALLAAIPDAAYFEQRSFGTDIRDSLRASDLPFGCYIRGAAEWSLEKHSVYPIYAVCKTNTEDNVHFRPFNYGSLVFSSLETGELFVFQVEDFAGKIPLAKPRISTPSHSDLPRAKTYSTDEHWRTFTTNDLRGGFGTYRAFLNAGDFQSQPYELKVVPPPGHMSVQPFEAELKSRGVPGKKEFGINDVTFESVTGVNLPLHDGVTLEAGRATVIHGVHHLPIHGAFRFAGHWPKEYERMPIHFLVSVEEVRDLTVKTLWLPRSKCHFQDGFYTGYFNFDLASLFITPWDGKPKPPEKAWISVVHRGWQGPIFQYNFVPIH